MRRTWGKKTTFKALTLLIAVLFTVLSAQSCAEKYVPFQSVPIANTASEYFMNMCENPQRYQNMFIYLVMEYYEKNNILDYTVSFNYNSDAFRECGRQFEEWKELYPAYAERMENSVGQLVSMSDSIKYKNMERDFNAMLKVITDFLAAELTQEAEFTAKYESLVSEEFLALCGADTMQKYCAENNVAVVSVEYDDYPSSLIHHYYPFSFDYAVTILYTENGEEPSEKNIKKTPLKLRYFVGIDKNKNYILEYVADVSVIETVPAPPLPDETEESEQ